jgi:hypothetical protein
MSMKQVIITVADSDAAFPELYVTSLERAIAESEDPHTTLYVPPIFLSRNALQVPASVRVTDVIWSIMVMQNLSNPWDVTFPCGCYSLSMVSWFDVHRSIKDGATSDLFVLLSY